MRLIILNTRSIFKSFFCKIIKCDDYSPHQLNDIYEFYSNKNGYYILNDWSDK